VSKKTFIGYLPYSHQKAVHNALNGGYRSGRIYVVKARRQVGKSIMVEQELLRYAITYTGTVSACVCPTLSQARKMFQDIIYCIIDSGVVKKKNETLLEIDLINGSKIFFKSAEQKDSLRGYTISGILCVDECAFINDEVFYELLLAWTNVHSAPILLTSTPKFKIGFFWSYWNIGVQETNPNVIAIDFNDYDTSALLSEERLEEYRKLLPKGQFLTEYMGEFLDSQSIVFGDFKNCIGGEIKEYKDVFIGIDWGSGVSSDYTVITGVNERNEQVFITYFNNKTSPQQIDFIVDYLDVYKNKVRCVVAETNGVGQPLVDALKNRLNWCKSIVGFCTTNADKIRLINRLQVYFEQKKIQLLDDDKQTNELSAYECQVKSNKSVTFNAPIGGNDDTVMALMFAEEAREIKNKRGNYNIR
jgi:hypothetical protein